MRIAACDDDKNVLQKVQQALEAENAAYQDMEATLFCDSNALLSALEDKARFDIYLLDILMPKTNGMELASAIRRTDESALIIFLTSSPEFAVDSYEVEAFGYLLKPFSSEKFHTILMKARRSLSKRSSDELTISSGGNLYRIPVFSVVCIEAMRNRLRYYLNDASVLESYGTISDLKNRLSADARFIQPHRSYLVNMEYIKEFETNSLTLTGQTLVIPVARANFRSLKPHYMDYMVHMAGGNVL